MDELPPPPPKKKSPPYTYKQYPKQTKPTAHALTGSFSNEILAISSWMSFRSISSTAWGLEVTWVGGGGMRK